MPKAKMKSKKLQELEEPPLPATITAKAEQKKVEERVAIGAHVVHETDMPR
jgi:hypothetical protein